MSEPTTTPLEERRAATISSATAKIRALVADEIAREKEEAAGRVIRRDMGRAFAEEYCAQQIVDLVAIEARKDHSKEVGALNDALLQEHTIVEELRQRLLWASSNGPVMPPTDTKGMQIDTFNGWDFELSRHLETFDAGGWLVVPGSVHVSILGGHGYGSSVSQRQELRPYIVLQMWRKRSA